MDNKIVFEAILLNDTQLFHKWLSKTKDLNVLNEENATPLQEAIGWGKREMAFELLTKSIDVNNQDEIGSTALHLAAEDLDTELIEELYLKKEQMFC